MLYCAACMHTAVLQLAVREQSTMQTEQASNDRAMSCTPSHQVILLSLARSLLNNNTKAVAVNWPGQTLYFTLYSTAALLKEGFWPTRQIMKK